MSTSAHPRCPKCGYDVSGNLSDLLRCPECGQQHRLIDCLRPWRRRNGWLCVLVSLVGGSAAWIGPALLGWRDGWVWWLWVGFTGLLSAVLGFLEPGHWWRWPTLLVAAQIATMQILPLGSVGLCFMSVILALCGLAAFFGAACREDVLVRH